ncbi:ABC transporter ATP-binding protein [cf. Phormidesmis sp. LEGE 11477]|uniref:ABC transporter ATP-binding protein n=1 Tax=cf. Phormidesmis sp. LEGE 11477 TaxID=1828680 RepID=UPI00187FE4C1|nr:ABC transporter ATP-binding protein [cf. Phormidesmis sp. LEGE 11477]MBE9061379.1 ABC transporter ATP-binding protein [cf. Phormidesmis sp. LEGE 11477]
MPSARPPNASALSSTTSSVTVSAPSSLSTSSRFSASSASDYGSASPILACRNLSKSFREGKHTSTILADVNLDIAAGDFVTILGQSGGGKSTLLKLLGGFMPLSQGDVLFHGIALKGITPRIGMVFQENTLYPWLTVAQNIGFGFKIKGKKPAQYKAQVQEVLEKVGLAQAQKLFPYQLSGGMKQRVSIARSIAVKPDVLLLDEPFSALDVQLRRRLQLFLYAVWQETGTTMVLVTHNVEEAILLGQQLIVIGSKPGKIIERVDISKAHFRDRYDSQFLSLQRHLETVIEGDVNPL